MKKRIYRGRDIDIDINTNKLIKETNKLIDQANKRLIRLTRGIDINKGKYNPKSKRFERVSKQVSRVKYDFDSWASKRMFEKLRVDPGKLQHVNKNDSYTDIMLHRKAVKDFLKSKTSTISGIREIVEEQKNIIRDKIEDFDTDRLDDEDVEILYNFWTDKDFLLATQYIDPSELWIALEDVSNQGGTSKDFLREMEQYIYSETLYKDLDLVEALERLYNKFNSIK